MCRLTQYCVGESLDVENHCQSLVRLSEGSPVSGKRFVLFYLKKRCNRIVYFHAFRISGFVTFHSLFLSLVSRLDAGTLLK